jgi:hypothetical protein
MQLGIIFYVFVEVWLALHSVIKCMCKSEN